MPIPGAVSLLTLFVGAFGASAASAQTVVARIVGPLNASGTRVTLTSVHGGQLSALGHAAGVPVGFEGLLPEPFAQPIVATGQPLGAVLDRLVKLDPRYEWREDHGVIVVRPIEAWFDDASLLHTPVAGMSLKDIMSADALALLAQMFGVRPFVMGQDSRRFSVEVRDGATLLETLNAIVREHGTLTWFLGPGAHSSPGFPLAMELLLGGSGGGFGIPAGTKVRSVAQPLRTDRNLMTSDLALLERRFENRGRNGLPLMHMINAQGVLTFADAVGVPLGFESLPASVPPVPMAVTGINVRGTLGRALDDIVAFDPRYEWRDVDGVIVIRPATAWSDPDNPLFRVVPAIRLDDVTISDALGALREALGGIGASPDFRDTRTFSINVPGGQTVLDVLTAICRAHGELAWAWEEVPVRERADWPAGHRYKLGITLPASGFTSSMAIP